MMSDTRIVAHVIRTTLHTFSQPNTRRDIAQRLRGIRNTSGRYAARLVLAEVSASWLTKYMR